MKARVEDPRDIEEIRKRWARDRDRTMRRRNRRIQVVTDADVETGSACLYDVLVEAQEGLQEARA